MDFLDKLKKGTRVIAEKSEELVEVAKIKISIGKTETELVKRQTELGVLVYNLSAEGKVNIPEAAGLCGEIDVLLREIDSLNFQLNELQVAANKEKKLCPNCSSENQHEAKFCAKCGSKII
ncbi:MAG: zinc-ribbon domain-containing protein [Eubacteriales bacterium]